MEDGNGIKSQTTLPPFIVQLSAGTQSNQESCQMSGFSRAFPPDTPFTVPPLLLC